jgi:hypothetical protein
MSNPPLERTLGRQAGARNRSGLPGVAQRHSVRPKLHPSRPRCAGKEPKGNCSVQLNTMFSQLLHRDRDNAVSDSSDPGAGRGGAAVRADAGMTGAPLLQGSATAGRETARGGAVGSKAEGPYLPEGKQGRKAAMHARGGTRAGARRVGAKAEVEEAARKVMVRNTIGRGPNEARHRIAARLRLCKIRRATVGQLAVRLSVRRFS